MSSITRSLKVPEILMEVLETRAKNLKMSFNAYMISLGRYDAICQGEHSITEPISRATGAQRDKVDRWLLRIVQKGMAKRGVLLKYLITKMRKLDALQALLNTAEESEADWSHWSI